MNHVFACPECAQKLSLGAEFVGKMVRCSKCRHAFPCPATSPEVPRSSPVSFAATPEVPIPSPVSFAETTSPALARERGPRRIRKFALIAFTVKVNDPEKALKGAMKAKLTPEGLLLTFKKKEIHLPAGGGAKYLKSNKLSVPHEGRNLELTVFKPFHYVKRLTRDIADFLDGGLDDIHGPDYRIPWYLIVLAMLPIGIPILTLGGALPALLGGGMTGLSLLIAQREQWSLAVRIVLCFVVAVVAYALFGALLVWVLMKQK